MTALGQALPPAPASGPATVTFTARLPGETLKSFSDDRKATYRALVALVAQKALSAAPDAPVPQPGEEGLPGTLLC